MWDQIIFLPTVGYFLFVLFNKKKIYLKELYETSDLSPMYLLSLNVSSNVLFSVLRKNE